MNTKKMIFAGGIAAGAALTLTGMAAMERASAKDPVQQGGGGFGGGQQGGQGGFGGPGGQGGQGGFGGPGGGQGGRGGFGGGQGGGFPGMGMMGGGAATIAATDKYVYILRGNTLYQYSVEGLKLLAKTEIPQPPRPAGGLGGGGFGGPPPDGNGPPPANSQK